KKLWTSKFALRLLGLVAVQMGSTVAALPLQQAARVVYDFPAMPPVMPGTAPLTWEGDMSARMLDEAHVYIDRKLTTAAEQRERHWKRDFSSQAAYQASIEPNRKRLMARLGVEDRDKP